MPVLATRERELLLGEASVSRRFFIGAIPNFDFTTPMKLARSRSLPLAAEEDDEDGNGDREPKACLLLIRFAVRDGSDFARLCHLAHLSLVPEVAILSNAVAAQSTRGAAEGESNPHAPVGAADFESCRTPTEPTPNLLPVAKRRSVIAADHPTQAHKRGKSCSRSSTLRG
jgi:hypothetical protein